jgi:hypothetical protein
MVIRTFLLVLFLISAALAGGVADYLVVANPLSYTIFNQYMQPISESEQAGFIPYSPFQVIEKDLTLGDQITRAMKFIFQQKEYYLLKDENGTLTGEESKTGRQNFRGAEVLGDTIEALAHGLTIADGKGKRVAIARGTRIARIFRSGPRSYCRTLDERPFYGWCTLGQGGSWKRVEGNDPVHMSAIDTGLAENLRQRILARLTSANGSYRALFSHFNSLGSDEKTVPQWHCESSNGRMTCRLAGSRFSGDELSESSKCLEQEIGNLLAGTDFMVTCSNGEIIIEKRVSGD